jgi:hypothetical protein
MKIKWKVSDKYSGVYSSSYNREWPAARYLAANGKEYSAGFISSQSQYNPSNVKTGAHEPLRVHVAVWQNPRIPSHSAFNWEKIGTVDTLSDAKKLLQDYINAHPEILPPDLVVAPIAQVRKSARVKP